MTDMTEETFWFPVEAGHILQFGRAIGNEHPLFTDRDHARRLGYADVLAPPTFMQASAHFDPDYYLRPKQDEPWVGSGREPSGDPDALAERANSMHAEHHFEYHRPVTAGETLQVRSRAGREWTKTSRNGGLLHFKERIFDYVGEDGEIAITARRVSVVVDGGDG